MDKEHGQECLCSDRCIRRKVFSLRKSAEIIMTWTGGASLGLRAAKRVGEKLLKQAEQLCYDMKRDRKKRRRRWL